MKNYIHVPTPEESEQVQLILFKLGYGWFSEHTEVIHQDRFYLVIEPKHKVITFTDDATWVEKYPEVTFKDLLKQLLIED
jgi:hypothetical protein